MQVSTHDLITPAANKQHKTEDQLPGYFNHGRILAPPAGVIPDLSFNLVGHQQTQQQQQQASVIQQITQQQRDQQKQNAEVIQKILQEIADLKNGLTTAQQVPVVGGAAQQQPAPGSNEAMTRGVTDPSAGRDVTKWASVMKSGKTEALIHGIRERYVNGLGYKVGGGQLLGFFRQLKNFVLGLECVEGWEGNPHFVELGNELLEQLWVQYYFCKDGTKRSELEMILEVASGDPLEKANAIAKGNRNAKMQQPKRKGGRSFVSTYPSSGNGRGFAK